MRYGRLDRRINLQRKTVTQSASGSMVETWANIGGRRWASVETPTGDERFSAPQLAAKQQIEFQVRWSPEIADLSPLDRIVYPGIASGTPSAGSLFDIHSVAEIGRREGLKIIASRRADV
jgi:head-tail adaptor